MSFNSVRRLVITSFSKTIYRKRAINYYCQFSSVIAKPNINFASRQVYFSAQLNVNRFTSQAEIEEVEEIDKSLYPELFPEHNDTDDAWFVDPAYENPRESEDFVPLWQRKADSLSNNSSDMNKYKLMESDNPQRTKLLNIIRFLEEGGIENITVIDVRQKCDFTDWMIIGEGKTTRHLGGAVDELYKMLKNETQIQNSDPTNSSQSYPIVEGRDSEDWMLIDTGFIFVHLFTPEARKYRNLEGLWEKIPSLSTSEEGAKRITSEIAKEFKEFNPKVTKNLPEL